MAGATLLRHLGPRLFAAAEPASGSLGASARGIMPAAARIFPARMASTDAKHVATEKPEEPATAATTEQSKDKNAIASYWGVQPRKLVKEDGTEWPWFCFTVRPVLLLNS
jgi:ubiquinol oxidase